MPPSIPINTGGQVRSGNGFVIALTPDNPNRYIRVVVSYDEDSVSFEFTPPGSVTALRVIGHKGKYVEDKPVTAGEPSSVTYRRDVLTDDEAALDFRIMFGASNGRLRGQQLSFPPADENPGADPVRLVSSGSLTTTNVAGVPMTEVAARFSGDIDELTDFLETSDDQGATVTDRGPIPANTPSVVGRWFRGVWGALGPNEDEPPNQEWLYNRTAWRTVIAATGVPDLGATVVNRSVFRPTNQQIYFTPIMRFPDLSGRTFDTIQFTTDLTTDTTPVWHRVTAKPGEAGSFDLFDINHPVAAGVFDNALFENDVRATGNRLRFRYRQTAAGAWSESTPGIDVPRPVVDPGEEPNPEPQPTGNRALWIPTQAETASAMGEGLQTYNTGPTGNPPNEGAGANNNDTIHACVLVALEAWAYETSTAAPRQYNGKTAKARLLEQLRLWGNANQTAPEGRSGYAAQYSVAFMAAVALARGTSAWSELTAVERNRLDLCMQGEFYSHCWVMSDGHPFKPWSFGTMRTIRGYNCGRDNAPNYSVPPKLGISLFIAYLRSAGFANAPAEGQRLLNVFDRDTFAAALNSAGGLQGMWQTYRRTWTLAVHNEMHPDNSADFIGTGPTAEQLGACLRFKNGAGNFISGAGTLADVRANLQAQMNRYNGATIQPGVPNKPGGETHDGVPGVYGIKHPSTGDNLRGCVYDKTKWSELPNRGQVGMAAELNTNDGAGVRSAMMYSQRGGLSTWCAMAAIAATGAVARGDPGWVDAANRMNRCIIDLQYRDQWGHWDYSKGGNTATSTNSLYNRAFANGRGMMLESRYAIVRLFNTWATQ